MFSPLASRSTSMINKDYLQCASNFTLYNFILSYLLHQVVYCEAKATKSSINLLPAIPLIPYKILVMELFNPARVTLVQLCFDHNIVVLS